MEEMGTSKLLLAYSFEKSDSQKDKDKPVFIIHQVVSHHVVLFCYM